MPTNQSKYAVTFSDLAYEEGTPVFPKAIQVGQYLEKYRETYIPKETLRLGCRVVGVEKVEKEDGESWKIDAGWKVSWVDEEHPDCTSSGLFTHLIIACGFFGAHKVEIHNPGSPETPVSIHSSQLESYGLDALLKSARPGTSAGNGKRNIVVVGGSMSGTEAAMSLAYKLSSELYSPESKSKKGQYEDVQVYHIATKPFWSLPPFLPLDPTLDPLTDQARVNPAPRFAPLDVGMYDFKKREPGPIMERPVKVSAESAAMMYGFFKALLGGDQSEIADGSIKIPENVRPPFVCVTEAYAEYVRSGGIKTIMGRATIPIAGVSEIKIRKSDGEEITLDSVVGIVRATGFPSPVLDYLPQDVLKAVQYDESDAFLPVVLDNHATNHPSVPRLGFVGFYSGPYWGVMEMQARFLGKLWAKDEEGLEGPKGLDGLTLEDRKAEFKPGFQLTKQQELRDAEKATERGQWPMSDMVGTLVEFASENGITRSTALENNDMDPVTPALYIEPKNETTEAEAAKIISQITKTVKSISGNAQYVPRATFRALQGSWVASRTLTSKNTQLPSGKFTGTATFHPRVPTKDGTKDEVDTPFDAEYLYHEEGEFSTPTGINVKTHKRYVYRYRELPTETLSVWFVKPQDDISVDYHFMDLAFSKPTGTETWGEGWKAKADHWCTPDQYDSEYYFKFEGISIVEWGAKFVVKGPNKDYVSDTVYRRS
jgi:Family of unknown function (DUF6314)